MSEQGDDRSGDAVGEATDGIVERLTPDEAFKLLGNDTRLNVLRVLFEADGPMAFSDIYAASDLRDSAQFNYHLDKLVGAFVDRGSDGYKLTTSGRHIVGTILAGRYTKSLESEPVDVDAACPACAGSLRATFEDGYVAVTCPDCERTLIRLPVPPGVFEGYPREEWPYVAERWTRAQVRLATDGFCPFCYGRMTSHVETDFAEIDEVDAIPDSFAAVELFTCERCGECLHSNVESSVLPEPEVVAFLLDHGVDVSATPVWELDWAIQPNAEVLSDDPLRVEVPVELDDERLDVVLGEDGHVVETRRSDAS